MQVPKYAGLIGTTRTVVAEEGGRALFQGLTAGLHRQLIFSGIRVGSYQTVKEAVCGPLEEGQNPALYQKIIAAMITGAIGITVANPTDVVKVRLQNQTKLEHFQQKGIWYNGTIDCYQKTI